MREPNYKCHIIADPKSMSWEFAKSIYEILKSRDSRSFELNEIQITKFRNNEIKTKIKDNVRKSDCFVIFDSNQDPQYWLTQIAFVNQSLKNSSAHEVINIIPNLFFSRQDRKDDSRVPNSSKVVADMIGLYADRIITIDVHSHQIQGFYDIPFDSLPSSKTVIEYLKEHHKDILKDITIASPDAGGGKRAEDFARRLENPYIAIGYKVRVKEGEVEELRFPREQVENRNIFLVDDIIDSGITLVEASKELRDKGAKKVYAYATHAFFTKGYGEVLGNLEKIFIGDTVKQPYANYNFENNRLEVISFAPLIAEAIYRISRGKSLSQLFE